MAIAGLHNVSVLDSSFLRESPSQSSRHHGDARRPSTQASSLLQMWRELEDEHVVSRVQDGYGEVLHQRRNDGLAANIISADTPQDQFIDERGVSGDPGISQDVGGLLSCNLRGIDHEHEVQKNSMCGRSDDFGEVERERVREIFQEWMNYSRREQAFNISCMNNHSRTESLGGTEQERMRTLRGSIQMNSEQRGACRESREAQATETGGRVGRVLDGLVVNQNRDWTEHIRRGNRRLCGRQVLLDMLNKAELERRKELQSLMMHRAVSQFAHRNRIQSLLRGRFLRNDRIVEDKRPCSLASRELGLLRQRHTVSGLREGFISRVEHSGNGQVSSCHSDILSDSGISGNTNDQTEAHNSHVVLNEFHEPSLSNNQDIHSCGLRDGSSGLEGNDVGDISRQESCNHAEDWQEQDSEHGARNSLPSATVEFVEGSDVTRQNLDGNWPDTSSIVWSEETLQNQEQEHSLPPETGEVLYEESDPADWLPSSSIEFVERSDASMQHVHLQLEEAGQLLYGQSEPISDIGTANVLLDHADIVEGDTIEGMNWQEFAAHVEEQEEQVQENEGIDWQGGSIENNDWRNGVGGDIDENQHERSGNEWSQELSADEDGDTQEYPEVWHEDGSFQGGEQNWLEEPSDHQAVPVQRVNLFDLPDDDNANSTELRELLSRRRVSSLLHSGFRARLDHLVQSYVERQSQASIDWELHETLPNPGEQDMEQGWDQNDAEGVAAGSPSLVIPSSPMLPAQSIWDSDLQNDNWQQHDIHPRLGIEWEIINDLRIDMARLQQRMNSMQSMLEACMEMQLELQRSIRQEVSAALNRSANSPGVCVDESKWEYVRKGICCMCCDNNIDSLLYRCGHMCACFECANGLVQSGGKCPMCLAPVVEVIRAYSIL